MANIVSNWSKSPAARKFYGVDVSNRLFPGDALDSSNPPSAYSNPAGLTISGVTYMAGNQVVALIAGGSPATRYEVVFVWGTQRGELDSEGVPLLVEAS